MMKLLPKEIRNRMKNVTSSKVRKFLNETDLMLEEHDKFILENIFYKKRSALNTSVMLNGAYTDKGIIYRIDNIIIKNNYDDFVEFLPDENWEPNL